MARFRADGAPDRGFGKRGRVTLEAGRKYQTGPLVTEDGGVFLQSSPRTDYRDAVITIQKFTTAGAADASFAQGGKLTFTTTLLIGRANLLSDGLVYPVISEKKTSFLRTAALVKVDFDGNRVTSFGTNGVAPISAAGALLEVDEQPDGKLILETTRLNADGTPDDSFGVVGLPGTLRAVGPDGVLYTSDPNGVQATATTGNAPSSYRLLDRTLTLFGTPRSDHLHVDTANFDASTPGLRVKREGWARTFANKQFDGFVVEAGGGGDQARVFLFDGVTRYDNTLLGGSGDDFLYVSALAGTTSGGSGDDTISAYTLTRGLGLPVLLSTLRGGAGRDTITTAGDAGTIAFGLFSDEGNDTLLSGQSTDTLTGGAGGNVLTGTEDDTFVRDGDDVA